MAEDKDKFVRMLNPQGEVEEVWDFADHVTNMLARGFTLLDLVEVKDSVAINKKNKESL